MTIANIKEACTRHFASKIGETEVEIEGKCDDTQSDSEDTGRKKTLKRKEGNAATVSKVTQSLPSPSKKGKMEGINTKSKFVSKSLSVSAILNLGRVVKSGSTMVNLNTFHLDTMVWTTVDIPVEFQISKDLLGQGGLRKAYRVKSNTQEFSNAEWVVKKYETSVLKEIEAINQTVEQHTMQVGGSNAPPCSKFCCATYTGSLGLRPKRFIW